jgi:ABC-type uncharacterized transport system involved in gliding motility auxiliary subunit
MLGLVLVVVGAALYGIFYTTGLIAIVPLAAGLALTAYALISSYRRLKTEGLRRSARFGVHAGVSILFLAAILIFLQTIIARHGASFDSTANKRYSLAPQTVSILDGLTSDVILTCFFKATSPEKLAAEDLLKEYARIGPRISYRVIDPDRDPVTARRYDIKPPGYGTIVVESGGVEEAITQTTEESLTNAILRVTREEKKVVCFTAGHGEREIGESAETGFSKLTEAIEAENYAARRLYTAQTERIPADCDVLVIAGPRTDFLPAERGIIAAYLKTGGDALILLDPLTEIPVVREIVRRYGIIARDDIIVDRFGRALAGNPLTSVVNRYGDHAITKGFALTSYYQQARSLSIADTLADGVTVERLATTAPQAFGETSVDALFEGASRFDAASDNAGPLHVAAVSTLLHGEPGGRTSRMVVFGDSDFASNASIDLSGNRDLILNTVNWLAEQEDLITIRPRDALTQPVVLSLRQGRIVFWLPVIGLPLLVLVLGFTVNLMRRT